MSVSCVVRQTDKTVYNNNCLFISFIVCLLFVYTCTHLESRKLHVLMYFTLPGPVFSVNGTLETGSSSGWQSVRRGGKGLVSNVIYSTVGS